MSNSDKTAKVGGIALPSASRGGIKGFFKEVVAEMKRVVWPKPKETTRLTGVVLGVCALVVVLLTAASFVIEQVLAIILKN